MSELKITYVGRRGDGVAQSSNGDFFVPFTLAGEVVEVEGDGKRKQVKSIREPSPDRIEPVCEHFGQCGGCNMQHMAEAKYIDWKTELVTRPLRSAGIKTQIEPLIVFPNASRRKADFSFLNSAKGPQIGFSEQGSKTVVPLNTCHVLVPEIVGQLEGFKDLISSLGRSNQVMRLSVLAAQNGLDVSIDGLAKLPDEIRQVLTRKAITHDFKRLSVNGETLLEVERPILNVSDVAVTPPAGGFVQAIEGAEHKMVELVAGHLSKCRNVVDLYAGMGTFALSLARTAKVLAVEENKSALESLERGWRETAGKLKQVKTEARNLERRPLGFKELKKIDGLVFDPPRAGAELQSRQIAKSNVGKVAAVSCNPVTLARDLTILMEGGYTVTHIQPIDQFKFTPHVEVVALLERN